MSLFLICFVTGLAILLFNLIFGSLSDFFSIDLDLDFDLPHGHMAHGILGFLSPSTLAGFLIAFGGIGYFFERLAMPIWLIWVVAILSGVIAGWLLWSLIRFLKRSENGGAVTEDDLIGISAEVVSAILPGEFGSIRYVVKGHQFSAPAVDYDGKGIRQGALVAVVDIRGKVFYVSEINLEE